jgi:branched-chain amino acid transport system ATP-binding protein
VSTVRGQDIKLRATGIVKHFGGLEVLRGIDLEVRKGEVHALIGPNGAGKSTFFNIVSGELRANQGSVEVLARHATKVPVHEVMRWGVGRAFQIPQVFKDMTVVESVAISVEAAERWRSGTARSRRWVLHVRDETLEQVDATLALLGLTRLGNRYVNELPHGDHKLVELAMAVAQEPELLLLDEPTAGMSPTEAAQCVEVIAGINAERGTSILLTEHDMDAVFRLATRISVLSGGKLIATDLPEAIRDNPDVREAYLGSGH